MCGIVGVFHSSRAEKQVFQALAMLQNRGRDGSKVVKINSTSWVGHCLHAIVNRVSQPLQGKGLLVANCEIYNWQELNKKYSLGAKNDADVLLKLFDTQGVTLEILDQLDGVYAFAYYHEGVVFLGRDILGEKPLWFSQEKGIFAFASEKKALLALGYHIVQEVHPRHLLQYSLRRKKLSSTYRSFFTYLPEHKKSLKIIQQKTSELLDESIKKRIPEKKFGLLFSGGIDSTFLAKYFKDNGYKVTCYTAVVDTENVVPSDLEAAQNVAKKLGLTLKVKKVKMSDIPSYLKKIVPLIEDSNVVKVGVALPFFIACEMARADGCKVIFSGLGSEEIFAGYERHKQSSNINQECVSGLLKMQERDLYRDDVLTMANGLELRLPYLDKELVDYALKIPAGYKLREGQTKWILRQIALERGLPREFAERKKTAAQYGSRFDYALGKLAKKDGFISKSAYLRQFYPSPNLRLGVLFSSGKDSASAAYIMKQQNYELACLITLKSKNKDSYMFQEAGTELVELQAKAMGLPIVIQETKGEKEAELDDLKKALQTARKKYRIDGVVTGALFSTYQRDRIERIGDEVGLKIFAPLWHKDQEQHLQELLRQGFKAIITKVAAEGLTEKWLGREIDGSFIEEIKGLQQKNGLNVAGEGGEFESLVIDGPLFKKKITLREVKTKMDSSCSGRLIIKKAVLAQKYNGRDQ